MNWRREISIEEFGWQIFLFAFVPAFLICDVFIDLWTPAAKDFSLPAEAHGYLAALVRGRVLGIGAALLIGFGLSSAVTRYKLQKYDIYRNLENENSSTGWRMWLGTAFLLVWLVLTLWTVIEPVFLAIQMLTAQFDSPADIEDAAVAFKKATHSFFQLACFAVVGWPLYRQSRVTRTHFLPKGVQDVR